MRKTDRVYGAVAKAIREVAATGKPFTFQDIEGGDRHRRLLRLLAKSGELRRVREGKPGRPGKEITIYQKA
jgi:hypothetical protein